MVNLAEGTYFGEVVKAKEINFFKLSLTRYDEFCIIDEHAHDNSYLSILTTGSYLEKSSNNTNQINPGDILFRPQIYTHQNRFNHSPATCFNIEFKTGCDTELDLKLKLPHQCVQYRTATVPSLYKLLLNFKSGSDPDLTFEFIFDWLCTINQVPHIGSHLPWVELVATILEQELEVHHSLKDIAARVCVHPVYLARAFKERKGLTIGEYQLKFKLAHAASRLLNTSEPITRIAFSHGFCDDPHFIRSFNAVYGISPYQFRLRIKS
jgi:AraC-like DNA-binding protein